MRAAPAVHPVPRKTGRKGRECRLGLKVGIGDGGGNLLCASHTVNWIGPRCRARGICGLSHRARFQRTAQRVAKSMFYTWTCVVRGEREYFRRYDDQRVKLYKGPAQPTRQVCQYGIRVSFWGSRTLKIVIYVENYPQKRCFRLADYHPLWGWGC